MKSGRKSWNRLLAVLLSCVLAAAAVIGTDTLTQTSWAAETDAAEDDDVAVVSDDTAADDTAVTEEDTSSGDADTSGSDDTVTEGDISSDDEGTSDGGDTAADDQDTPDGDDTAADDDAVTGDEDTSGGDDTATDDAVTDDDTASDNQDASDGNDAAAGDEDTSGGDDAVTGDEDTSNGDDAASDNQDTSDGDDAALGDEDTSDDNDIASGDDAVTEDTDTSGSDDTASDNQDISDGDDAVTEDDTAADGEDADADGEDSGEEEDEDEETAAEEGADTSHTYGNPEWTWSEVTLEDGTESYAAVLTLTCEAEDCDAQISFDADVEIIDEKEATEEEDGSITYEATVIVSSAALTHTDGNSADGADVSEGSDEDGGEDVIYTDTLTVATEYEADEEEIITLTSASVNGITVTVTGTAGALGDAAGVDVSAVEGKDETYAEEAGEQNGKDYEVLAVLDVTLVDGDGEAVEPEGEVSVTFSGSAISEYSSAIGDTTEEVEEGDGSEENNDGEDGSADEDSEEDGVILVSSAEDFYGASAVTTTTVTTTVTAIEVIHVDESGKETNYESVASAEEEVSSIEFDTDSFSDFCLVQVVEGLEESAYDVTTNEGVLSSGTYKLTADVDLGAASEDSGDGTAAASDTTTEGDTTCYDLTVPSGTTVTLDLNGHTLTGTGDGSVITVYGTFTLTDSAAATDSDGNYTSGTITGGTGTTNSAGTGTFGGGIAVFSGTFTMEDGTISGNTATYSGGGVFVYNGTFTMNGGAISDNSASAYDGGGVYIQSSTFTMNDGEISGNTGRYGGGISVYPGTFMMNGGTISGNTAKSSTSTSVNGYGGGVYAYSNSAEITINGGTISSNTAYLGGGLYIQNSSLTMTDGTVTSNTASSGSTDGSGGGIDIQAGTFTMSGGTITSNTAGNRGGGVYVIGTSDASASMTMSGGTISNNTAYRNGGGISVTDTYDSGNNTATLTMTDGEIKNNTVTIESSNGSGGGVGVSGGATFTMEGGTIYGNSAWYGGGVDLGEVSSYESDSSFIMTDGTISGNTATLYGGGVAVGSYLWPNYLRGNFKMSGGTISGNKVGGAGGGVAVNYGSTFTLSGGTISGNKATGFTSSSDENTLKGGSGGGIALGDDTEVDSSDDEDDYTVNFTMTGGTVTENYARLEGGGISIFSYGASINAGTISDNEAGECGGGIYIHQPYTLTLKNVVVTDNTASIIGGGVWACPHGSIALYISEGGAIYDNTAAASADSEYTAAGSSIAYVEGDGSPMTLSSRMLGGGALTWYYDGGITIEENANGTGTNYVGEGNTTSYARYSADSNSNTELTTLTDITESTALKSVTEGACAESLAMALADLVITGNSAQRGGGIASNGGLTIGDSTGETTSITVTKVWDDKSDVDGIRPDSVTVYLYNTVTFTEENEDGTTTTTTQKYLVETAVIEADEDGNWTYTFTDLPVDGSFSYSVEEAAVDDDYTATITGGVQEDGTYSYTITNSHTPATKPDLKKVASDTDVEPGDTVTFTLTSNVPDDLDRYLEDDEAQTGDGDSNETGCSCGVEGCACTGGDCGCSVNDTGSAEEESESEDGESGDDETDGDSEDTGDDETGEASYILTFHDVMSDIFTLNNGSFSVTVNGVTLDSSLYTITTDTDDGCSFHVTMDLVKIYEAGSYFALSEIDNCPAIVVTYSATVSEDASGTYRNTSWVGYEGGNSDPSTVKITVWDISKTATNLELVEDEDSDYYGTYLSDVTLSVPSMEVELDTDIVFVLDKSTSPDLQQQAVELLEDLQSSVSGSEASVKVAVVVFNKYATTFGWYDLETQFDKIKEAIYYEISSGTNTHAGLLAAQELLDSDTEVDANRKYMIFVSDGITYMYDEDYTVTAWGWYSDGNGSVAGSTLSTWSGPSIWGAKFGKTSATDYSTDDSYIPDDWWTFLQNVGTQYATQEEENNGAGYEYTYGGTCTYSTDPEKYNVYVNSVEIALYKTYTVYQEMVASGYNCYSVVANTGSGSQYVWGPSFMKFLAGGESIDFDDIEKEILYYLSAGSYIEDYMGYVEDGYDFDFVSDASMLSLEVGDTTYGAVEIGSDADGHPQYGFAPYTDGDGNTMYSYVLTYYYEGGGENEHFRLVFNVSVTNFQRVQLHYTVQLNPDSVTDGAHGVYDADGSGDYSGLLTNSSAVLYPVDSEGNSHGPIDFDQPTVSYLAIPVTKIWNDNHDADGIRPEEIIVYLLADGEKVPVYVYDEDGELTEATDEDGNVIYRTLVLSGDNDWIGTFLIHSYDPNVDDGVVYSVCEVVEVLNEETGELEEQEIEGYFADITAEATQEVETSGNGKTAVTLTSWSFVIINTPDTEVAVSKSGDKSSAKAGDTVSYTTVVNVPNYLAAYASDDSFEVVVHDVMDEEFSYGEDLSVAIDNGTGSGTAIDAGLYTVSVSADDGCTFEAAIDLVALVNAGLLEADEDGDYPDLILTYTATLAEDAAAGTYDNTTWATYVKDGEDQTTSESAWSVTIPEEEPEEEETTEEETEEETETETTTTTEAAATSMTTGALAIIKVDAETGARLAGATFALYNDTEGTLIGYYKTDSNGYLVTSQLTLNYTYSFVEVGAPDGYVLDSTPHTVTLTSSLSSSVDSPYVLTVSNTAESSVLDADRGDETDGTEDGTVLGTDRDAVSETGDDSNVLFWLILMLAAGAGLGAVIFAMRRQKRR